MTGQKQARRRPSQLEFTLRTWGGARRGAGRKPKGPKARVGHDSRPPLASRFPVHVTLKLLPVVGNPRRERLYQRIEDAIRAGNKKQDFRVCHFSVQDGHIHLICEAHNASALSRGVQGVSIRIARAINRALNRKGKVFADRFHSRVLRTPTETRTTLAYVLNNRVSHILRRGDEPAAKVWIDPCSSGPWFDGWKVQPDHGSARGPDPPVAKPKTWLLETGWRFRGLLVPGDVRVPRPARRRRRRKK
jgi:REP-associated tyrosine transposase